MADKKISALTAAATPLAGTEVLPIVQGGSTVKVSVADLTAGRAVSSSNLTYTGTLTGSTGVLNIGSGQVYKDASGNIAVGSTSPSFAAGSGIMIERGVAPCISFKETGGTAFDIFNIFGSGIISNRSNNPINVEINGAAHSTFVANGSFAVANGNVVLGTAGKGIDFSANGGDVLSQYDEGTYTPVFTASSSNPTVTYGLQRGKYVRVGNVVTVSAFISWSAISGGSGDLRISLPFAGESSVGASGAGPISSLDGFTFAAGRTFCSFQPQANVLYGNLPQTGSGVSSSNTTIAQMASSGLIIFSCTYLI